MVHLDYRDSRPIYAQIVDGFREQITGGVLRPGRSCPASGIWPLSLPLTPIPSSALTGGWRRRGGSPPCRERAASSAATERSENGRKNGCC